jgi:hypothetical protein
MSDEELAKEARRKEEELLLLNWWAAFHRNRAKAQAGQQPAREIRSNFRRVELEPAREYHSNLRNNSEARPSMYCTTPQAATLALLHAQIPQPVSASVFSFTDIDDPDDDQRRRLAAREEPKHPEESRKAWAEYYRVKRLMETGQAVVIDD